MKFFLTKWVLSRKTLVFAIVMVLATFFRLYQLGIVPSGLSWDETAIGYNGSAIWRTRRDEWLIKLPVSFKSFGDYKAPLAIYINAPFTAFFGMNAWAVRLPFALAGIASIVFMAGIMFELFQKIPHRMKIPDFKNFAISEVVVFVGIILMASSVWHIHFSRAGFESGMALAFTNFMVWMWLLTQRFLAEKRKNFALMSVIMAGVSGALAMYTYHSAKVAIPLLIGIFFLVSFLQQRQKIKLLSLLILSLLIVSYPLINDSLFAQGAERFHQTSIFGEFSGIQIPVIITRNYFAHFSLDYLIQGKTTTLRHGDGTWGVLFVTELILLLTSGLGMLFLMRRSRQSQQIKEITRVFLFGLGWVIAGLMPAAIGTEIPHANRALLAYPGFLILMCLGVFFLFKLWFFLIHNSHIYMKGRIFQSEDSLLVLKSFLGLLVLVHGLLFLSYWKTYFTQYRDDSASAFQYGYEQAFDYVIAEEDKVDKILFTDVYGQPYIYALFFRQTNPIWYQGGSLIKYEFTDKINSGDLLRKNTIIVADPDQIDPALGDSLILAPDGSVRFVLKKTTE